MKIKEYRLTLKMQGAVIKIGNQHREIEELKLSWTTETIQEEILFISKRWLTEPNLVTERFKGLQSVKHSELIIEPLKETKKEI